MRAHASLSRRHWLGLALAAGGLAASGSVRCVLAQVLAQTPGQIVAPAPIVPLPIAPPGYMEAAEKALAPPFKGITPNGNDYGKDLLRQHHEQFDYSRSGPGHPHAGQDHGSERRR